MNEDSQKVNIAQSVRHLREILPAMIEHAEIQARLCKARFDALVAQGFTESQALELCWRAL